MDTGGEVVLLQKQVQLLQDEVTRLRLRGEEPARGKAEPAIKNLPNGDTGDVNKGKKVQKGDFYLKRPFKMHIISLRTNIQLTN